MSEADRLALRYVAEGSFGVTPTGTATQFKELRFTGESLKQNQKNIPFGD